jgi:1,4-dihydroxy-2-naphthoyl-CoA synthase
MEYEILKIQVADGIATVVISRPQALNALNSRFFKEMSEGDRVTVEIVVKSDDRVTASCREKFVRVRPGHPAYHRW